MEFKKKQGFASLSKERLTEIAREGGKAAHAKGTAHRFTSEEARIAGQKGGLVIGQNKEHMAAIGRKGGKNRISFVVLSGKMIRGTTAELQRKIKEFQTASKKDPNHVTITEHPLPEKIPLRKVQNKTYNGEEE